MSMKEDVINMKKQVEEIKKDNPETFAMSMFKENSKLTKKLFTIIYILVGIIALFVGVIVYFVTNYDIGVENTTTELTGDGETKMSEIFKKDIDKEIKRLKKDK